MRLFRGTNPEYDFNIIRAALLLYELHHLGGHYERATISISIYSLLNIESDSY